MRACKPVQANGIVPRRALAARFGLVAICTAAFLTLPAASAPASNGARTSPPWFVTQVPPVAPATALAVLTCLASLLSCALSLTLWQRADATQQAAHAAMQASAKLLDHAARRFARQQDEAGGAIDAAGNAAIQAGQAAARLTAVARETEARLSICVAGVEAGLQAALAGAQEARAGGEHADHSMADGAAAAIEAAAAALHHSAEAASTRLRDNLRILPGLLAQALQVADARGVAAIKEAAAGLAGPAAALPQAADSVIQAATSLVQVQQRTELIMGRVEALAGVLPAIATSLASTAAGQRQLVAQASTAMNCSAQQLRDALIAQADAARAELRRAAAAPQASAHIVPGPSAHPALRHRDLHVPRHNTSPAAAALLREDAVPS